MKQIFFFLVFLYTSCLIGQEHAWVYLADKPNSTSALSNPISILSQKALDRKAAHNVAIDFRDVPVDESYISLIKSQTGITVLAKSKWFNAVHVLGTPIAINGLSNLMVNQQSIVASIDFADSSLNTRVSNNQTIFKHTDKHIVEADLTVFNYGNAANQIEMINGDALHLDNYTGTGMTVAVLDSGFPNVNTMSGFQRLRDNNNLLGGYDFVDRTADVYAHQGSSHGTWVLSDMAGFVQDEFVGTAPDASYYLFRTEKGATETPMEESLWVEAAERADSLGVDVINSSLGYTTFDNPNYDYTPAQMDGNTAFITKGANIAHEKGILVVNSAGNSGNSSWQIVGAPADAAGVFSIGAVDSNGNAAFFTSKGSNAQPTQKPDVVAQGLSSYAIEINDNLRTISGTSFSAPILAGSIVCLWQAKPNLSNAQIMQFVRESASQFLTPDNILGHGIPDFDKALDNVLLSNSDFEKQSHTVFPNPVLNTLNVISSQSYQNARVIIFDVLGKKVMETLLEKDKTTIDTRQLIKGLYLVKILSDDLTVYKKIIKD